MTNMDGEWSFRGAPTSDSASNDQSSLLFAPEKQGVFALNLVFGEPR